MIQRFVPLVLSVALSALHVACGSLPHEAPASLAQASALAVRRGVPVLVDFYADWCGPCQRFAAEAAENPELQQALSRVVVYKVDVEADGPEGSELAERFAIGGYPTFVVLDATTETIDRWWGYEGATDVVERLERALADPTTIAEKQARFEDRPTAADAATLGEYHLTRKEPVEAARYFERAVELGEPSAGYEYDLFQARSVALFEQRMELSQLQQAADAALGSAYLSVEQILDVVVDMTSALKEHGDTAAMVPYLEAGMAALDDVDDPELEPRRLELSIRHALHVLGDKELAVALKREAMSEGWNDDPGRLNNFAWWCFENEVNLAEAERLAQRAVELAETPEARAMYLDTAAELVNLRGDRSEAVALMRRAIVEDPERGYFKEQLTRFQGELSGAL